MNQLPLQKKKQIINLLVEGVSLRAASRIADCSINTVTKLLIDVGRACQRFHNETVGNLIVKRVECDEIWSFVYSKQKNVPDKKIGEAGDVWTFVGIDCDTKLVVSWLVGNRDLETASIFIEDLAYRINSRIQLSTDGLKVYVDAVRRTYGDDGIDYSQIIKHYSTEVEGERKYSPAKCTSIHKNSIIGNPDPDYISTSLIERQNLTMRMHMRRFTRLTNAFSKKIENHCYAIALHFVYYNFSKIHKTLRVTPAMEAGLTKDLMEIEDIIQLVDRYKNH